MCRNVSPKSEPAQKKLAGFAPESLAGFAPESVAGFGAESRQGLRRNTHNYGDLALMPGQSGEFTTRDLAVYIGPMFDIGKKSNLSSGLAQNYLLSSDLKTTTVTKDVSIETTNYSSLFFDYRHQITNKISLGTRYEWGLNSMFKFTDREVSTISFNAIIQFGKKSNQ